ncbi:MAG: hypothetical protein ACREQ5_39725, partial [Candidatus Dormibacteria bacterium]
MGQVLLPVGSIPPTPATGYTAFYVGTDKKLYFIDDAGVIHPTEAPVLSSPGPIGNVTPSTIASTQFTGPLTGNVLGGASMAGSGSYFCMRNKLINGNFAINQRVQVTGVALAAGIYGHDRWKAGAGGCTYTFAQTKPDTLLTITAGTLVQVIEDVNCTESSYVISWQGTAQGRLDSGSYSASPLLVSGKTLGTQMQMEFNTGTLGTVQVEAGTVPTPFERRFIGFEMSLCQRYLPIFTGVDFLGAGYVANATSVCVVIITFKVSAR